MYKWQTGTWTLPNWDKYTFRITDKFDTSDWIMYTLKILSGEYNSQYGFLAEYEIDETLTFD